NPVLSTTRRALWERSQTRSPHLPAPKASTPMPRLWKPASMTEETRKNRTAQVKRRTHETDIEVVLRLDGEGTSRIETGGGFFDHMLTHVARHGLFDLDVTAKGDLHIDDHHTVEDVGIALGQAFAAALGDRAGIARVGNVMAPMDEALVLCAIDVSGRGFLA